MSEVIRFPSLSATPIAANESNLVRTLIAGVPAIPVGGIGAASIVNWRVAQQGLSTPFVDAVVEWTSDVAITIGSGTDPICLVGSRVIGGVNEFFTLGVLGISIGAAMPQIPIVANATFGGFTGFAQVVQNVGLYDVLSVGTLTAPFAFGAAAVSATVRPVFRRNYGG